MLSHSIVLPLGRASGYGQTAPHYGALCLQYPGFVDWGGWRGPTPVPHMPLERSMVLQDYGPRPLVVDIEEATEQNHNFRTVLWTGKHMQLTLMHLRPGEDIGLEQHTTVDQFLRIEEGKGVVQMGSQPGQLNIQQVVDEDNAILIPAGIWHNLTNTGDRPLKLYSIYAPPEHPPQTIHETKAAAEAAEALGR